MTWELDPIPSTATEASSRYASQGDVEDVFGVENVRQWSNIENVDAETNATRVQRALDWACDVIDNEFRGGPYALPLQVGTGRAELTDWAAKLAGIWLYRSRGHRDDDASGAAYDQMETEVRIAIRNAKDGRRLDAQLAYSPTPTCPVVIR